MKNSFRLILAMLGFAASHASAAPLGEGEFTRVINDVRIVPVGSSAVPAKPGDRISGRTAVSTGAQSRAELRFPDKTLTRVGANSVFRMDQSSRTVDLEKGVILLQVPKQLGGAKIRTAAVTAAVTGTTVLFEFTPDGFMKLIVVEGEVDVSLNERRNQFRTLTAGDMWISRADDKTGLPLPVQVDLERLKKTSKLLSAEEFPPLGNEKQLDAALKDQDKKKQKGDLVSTSFQIEGRGRNVTLLVADRHVVPVVQSLVAAPPAPRDRKPINIPETTVFDDSSTIGTLSNAYNSAAGGFTSLPGTTYLPEQDGLFGDYMFDDPEAFSGLDPLLSEASSWLVLKGDEIYISGNPAVSPDGSPNLIVGATGDINFTASPPFQTSTFGTGDSWTLDANSASLVFPSLRGSINFDSFNLIGTDQDVRFLADGGSGDVNIRGNSSARISLPAGNFDAAAGRDVNVTNASVEAKTIRMSAENDIHLGEPSGAATLAASESISLKAKQSITISNSSQLRELSQMDNPQILVESLEGNLIISDSSLNADVVNLVSQRGDVNLVNSNIAAREIKAKVFDTGGILQIDRSTLGRGANPSDLIRLYGEGSEGVRFSGGLTTLRGDIVEIAGKSVTIDAGSRVRLSNPAGTTVYSDIRNFNNNINGNFTGLSNSQTGPVEVIKKPYGERPPF